MTPGTRDACCWGMRTRFHMNREDMIWIATVLACSFFVLGIMIYWSRLRGY